MELSITLEEFIRIEEALAYYIGKRKQYGSSTKEFVDILNKLEKQYINSIENENKSTR